ncbi:MAG TPA: type II secretion system protein N [Candidatus Binataceae bacterium]
MELRFTERHVTALNFLAIIVLAYFAAASANDVIARALSGNPAAVGPEAPVSIDTTVRPRAYYEQIVTRDVFNLVPQAEPTVAVAEEDLNLKLLGTSQLSLAKPFAIIEDHTGTQNLYQLGEDIPDAGRLVGVEKTRALIDHNGHRVAIEIENADGEPGAPVPVAAEPVQMPPVRMHRSRREIRRRNLRNPMAPNASNDPLDINKVGENHFTLKKKDLEDKLRQPGDLVTDLQATPVLQDGKYDGYTVSSIAPGSTFDEVGLKDGDVVTSINGQPLGNPLQAMGQMGTITTSPSVKVGVTRNGAPLTIQFDLH